MATSVLALVGSLRQESKNKELAELARDLAPEGVSVSLFEGLDELPFYNEDIDGDQVAEAVTRLRTAVADADAVLVVTPEYNGTIPAVLKNAIDWASRPFGNGSLTDKPVAVIGASLGRFGGKWSHDDTRKAVGIAGARVVEDVEVGLQSSTYDRAAEDEQVVDKVRGALTRLVDFSGVPA